MEVKTISLANRVMLEYAEQGHPSGLPLILLHGYTDSWHSFEPMLRYLPATLHAFVLSQRGHGRSERPAEGYRLTDFAADVAAFIDARHLGSALIVGHSMGAFVAQRFALDFPQKTRAVVLIGALAAFAGNEGVAELEAAVARLSDPVDPAFVEDFQQSTLGQPVEEAFFQTVVEESLLLPARVWQAVLAGMAAVDYTEELRTIDKPVLLLWGDRDVFVPPGDQDRLLQAMPGAQLVTYAGTGHAVHWEEPQRVAADVAEFAARVAPDTA